MAAPPRPVRCANTRGAAAITVAAAPVFSILRLIESTIGMLLTFSRLTEHCAHVSTRQMVLGVLWVLGVVGWDADDERGPNFRRHAEVEQPDRATARRRHSDCSRRSSSQQRSS